MKRLLYLLSACLMTFGFSACNDDDDNLKLQDISVEFAVSEAGMDGETVSLGLKLSRATTESLDVTIAFSASPNRRTAVRSLKIMLFTICSG